MAQKITHWLLIAIVLSLGFGQLLRLSYLGQSFYIHDIMVVTILLLNVSQLKSFFNFAVLRIFFIGLIISSLYAITNYQLASLLTPSLYLARLMSYLFLYFVYKNSQLNIPRSAFYLSGIITIIIGITQYLFMPDMRWAYYLGWDDHLSRLVLPHFDPTFSAAMTSMFLLILPKIYSSQNVLVGILSLLTILLSYSRSTWLSLSATGIYFIRRKSLLVLALIVLFLGISLLPKRFGEGTNILRVFSISSRINSDKDYLSKYGSKILTGVGLNTFAITHSPQIYDNHAVSPNNSYLYILLTTGLFGFVGWTKFLFNLYKNSTHKEMLVFFFIASLFNNVMFYPFALIWVLLIEARAPSAT